MYSTHHGYKTHVEEKHQDYVWKCKICQREFNSHTSLRSHIPSHSLTKPYKCWLCDYFSAFKGNVAIHAQKTHKVTGSVFTRILKVCEHRYNTNIKGPFYEKYYKPGGAEYTGRKRQNIPQYQ